MRDETGLRFFGSTRLARVLNLFSAQPKLYFTLTARAQWEKWRQNSPWQNAVTQRKKVVFCSTDSGSCNNEKNKPSERHEIEIGIAWVRGECSDQQTITGTHIRIKKPWTSSQFMGEFKIGQLHFHYFLYLLLMFHIFGIFTRVKFFHVPDCYKYTALKLRTDSLTNGHFCNLDDERI